MSRLAAGLWGCAAAMALLLGVLPQPPNGSRAMLLALAGAAALVGLLLRLGAGRLPGWALPASAAMATLLSSALTAVGGANSWIDVQVIYVWVALGSAYFFSTRLVVVQLALIAGSYALVLSMTSTLVEGAPRFLATMASTLAAAVLVGALRTRVAEIVSRLADAARTDPLTGLQNRRGFEESFGAEVDRAAREGRELAVVLGDLDHFKSLNDRL
ncbi:MAG TPA: diguanylate cyclase, partial [Thermoleophilaceae bacterium]